MKLKHSKVLGSSNFFLIFSFILWFVSKIWVFNRKRGILRDALLQMRTKFLRNGADFLGFHAPPISQNLAFQDCHRWGMVLVGPLSHHRPDPIIQWIEIWTTRGPLLRSPKGSFLLLEKFQCFFFEQWAGALYCWNIIRAGDLPVPWAVATSCIQGTSVFLRVSI